MRYAALSLLVSLLAAGVLAAGPQDEARARAALALALQTQAPCPPQAPDCHDEEPRSLIYAPPGTYFRLPPTPEYPQGRLVTSYDPALYQPRANQPDEFRRLPASGVAGWSSQPAYQAPPAYFAPPRAYQGPFRGGYRGSGSGSCGPRG